MLIRCQRNTTALYVVHGDYEVNDTMQVSWRVDGGAAKKGENRACHFASYITLPYKTPLNFRWEGTF